MSTEIVMPKLGESLVEGKISRWLKREGDQIGLNEPILEIETDKVSTEIPASTAGTLLKIAVPEGMTVRVGEVLGIIGDASELVSSVSQSDAAMVEATLPGPESIHATPAAAAISPVAARLVAEHRIDPGPIKGSGPGGRIMKEDVTPHIDRVMRQPSTAVAIAEAASGERYAGLISPLVSRLVARYNVDLSAVAGSGRGGRVRKMDVLGYLSTLGIVPNEAELAAEISAAGQVSVPQAPVTLPQSPESRALVPSPAATSTSAASQPSLLAADTLLPHTAMRRSIAEHMVRSVRTSPHVTTMMEADLSAVVAHRTANKAAYGQQGVHLTFTAYFIVAAAAALRHHPLANASWREDGMQLHHSIDVGMATALDNNGLIVPVIRQVTEKSLLGVARSVNDLASRARANQLKPDEISGATFTVTNHGTTGSLMATPIINQPQSAILGVGAIVDRVIAIRGAIAIRPMVYLSLSFDHRILDGASADRFLSDIKKRLESWESA